MKGLIYKDFMCLRKGLKTFVLVTVGVIVLGVMFLLSARYGNMADSLRQMQAEGSLEADVTMSVVETSVWFMLFVPIAFMADVTQCFREDAGVGFGSVLSGMALTRYQIVGSRYLTTLIYGIVSIGASLVTALAISTTSVSLTTGSLVAGVFSMGCIFLIYMSFNLFMIYLCGARRADLIQTIPLVILFFLMGNLIMRYADLPDDETNRLIMEMKERAVLFLQGGYKVLFPVAAVSMVLSYIGSVAVLKYRRRVL